MPSGMHDVRPDGQRFSTVEAIEACAQAGFTHIDITLASCCDPAHPFAGEQYQTWLDGVTEALARTGLAVNQTHTVFYKHIDAPERLAFYERMVDRCLQASARLQAPWTVMHILRPIDLALDREEKDEALARNAAYFLPYGEKARRYGVGIAIENGLTGFFHSADELLALLDRLNDPVFGLCWDTGHANITGQDQAAAILRMNENLKCLHINDNDGARDQHLLPAFGTVDFAPIMDALHRLADPPMLTLECGGSTRRLPACARADALRLAARLTHWLETL